MAKQKGKTRVTDLPQYLLYLPVKLNKEIRERAEKNRRSIRNEIIFLLEQSLKNLAGEG